MTTIERIGQFSVVRHGPVFILVDRKHEYGIETFTRERDARDAALERVDVVDFFEATAAINHVTLARVN